MAERTIAHFDLDSFFVSVERLKNSKLVGKPVIVGGQSDRGVVAGCSYEARKFGVSSAMPTKLARRLCPDALFIKGDFESYMQYSALVSEIMEDRLPVLEKASIDEFYADFTGMDRFFGNFNYALDLKKRVLKETGLTISFGMSTSKTVSKVATNESKPDAKRKIDSGDEKKFLSPLPIISMPMIGKVNGQHLRNMGIKTIGMLSQMPVEMLEAVMGKNGVMLWERANGIDDAPVTPYHERKSHSKEMTFDKDTIDVDLLKSILAKMIEEITFDLRSKTQCAGLIAVKVRYSNFDTHTRQVNIPYTASDETLREKALEIFDKLYDRRLLIRLVGVRFSKLVPGYSQINLFDRSSDMAGLYQAMDKIRLRYGVKAVQTAFATRLYEKKKEDREERRAAETARGLPPERLRNHYMSF
ncbi:DNA polymerase IV [Emticicia sp. CRIBPO]|uniref:DNA polymerase IV n=1 Tax=Emticicia sp. CRIBPO TaxID=2683258 RepID=UPI0014131C62|nr:DNA polymerase IV [Emticicia sp. CRIBPO]NBA88691.1 DNA polymerase IV [Emticicia sp. CRIBPO]